MKRQTITGNDHGDAVRRVCWWVGQIVTNKNLLFQSLRQVIGGERVPTTVIQTTLLSENKSGFLRIFSDINSTTLY